MRFQDILRMYYNYIFLTLLLLMMFYRNRNMEKRVQGSFYGLVFGTLLLFVMNCLEMYIDMIPNMGKWCALLSYVKYAIKPALLCQVLLISERDKTDREKLKLMIPLFLLVLILMVSYPSGWVVYYTGPDNVFHYGPLIPVTWGSLLLYMIMIIRSAIASHDSQEECFFLLLGEGFILFIVSDKNNLTFEAA